MTKRWSSGFSLLRGDFMQPKEYDRLTPEADIFTAGGVSHRIKGHPRSQARRATQDDDHFVSPYGLEFIPHWFRRLTAPAMLVSASGLRWIQPRGWIPIFSGYNRSSLGKVHAGFLAFLIVCFTITSNHVAMAADVVVVCHETLRDELSPWVKLRNDQGMNIAFCEQRSDAKKTAKEIQSKADSSTRYVLLVGDAPTIGISREAGSVRIPTFDLPSVVTHRYGSTPSYPTDLPYGDFDSDGLSDASVGRIPIVDREQLSAFVKRLLVYETSRDFGTWRQCLQLTAGVGGFGPMIDGAIETVTRTVLTSALPADVKPQIAYASPGHLFCPVEESFADCVMRRYRNGARFWIYAGHGRVDQLDLLERSDNDAAGLQSTDGGPQPAWQVRSLLNNQSVSKLETTTSRASIAVLLACYTGAYDAPGDSLAEKMLLTPGGPIAVIAASRLTMPYGNARYGLGLLESVYQPLPKEVNASEFRRVLEVRKNSEFRLGDAILRTQRQLQSGQSGSPTQSIVDGVAALISPVGSDLGDERIEHVGLYQLMGDPTLRLFHPVELQIEVALKLDGENSGDNESERLAETSIVLIELESSIPGKLNLWVDCPLGQPSLFPTDATSGIDPHGCTLTDVCMSIQSNVKTKATLRLPTGFTGPVVVRAFVEGANQWGTAATRMIIH